jgi:hypothetical protein
VAVKIKHQEKLLVVVFSQGLAQLLRIVNCWVCSFAWLQPFTVEITGGKGAAVVAVYDAVDVEHRNDVEFEMIFEIVDEHLFLSVFWVEEGIHQSMNHPGSASLSRVHS